MDQIMLIRWKFRLASLQPLVLFTDLNIQKFNAKRGLSDNFDLLFMAGWSTWATDLFI